MNPHHHELEPANTGNAIGNEQRPGPPNDAPDRHLAIPNYRHLAVRETLRKAAELTREQLEAILKFELATRNRKTLLAGLERLLRLDERGEG